jgi:hypothetical protein
VQEANCFRRAFRAVPGANRPNGPRLGTYDTSKSGAMKQPMMNRYSAKMSERSLTLRVR